MYSVIGLILEDAGNEGTKEHRPLKLMRQDVVPHTLRLPSD